MSASDASRAPTVFTPVSVTAISTDDWWVLGYSMTTYADGYSGGGATVLRTLDGGRHFAQVGSPGVLVARAPMSRPSGTPTVSDVRFGNATDGWAYGNALYSTTDGGRSWSAVSGIPGAVVDLVAANGVAWAVVDLSQTGMPTPPPSLDPNSKYAIYSTPYGNSPQHWTRAVMPFDLGAARPSIVDQDGTVTMLVSGPLRDDDRDHVLIAAPGKEFIDHVGPCFQELGGTLSNSKDAIWASCPTGHAAGLLISTDRGANWHSYLGPAFFPDPGTGIAAIDDHDAVVLDTGRGSLRHISTNGPESISTTPVSDVVVFFIGFTDPTTGFAIGSGHEGPTELWRTTDGGLRWSVVEVDLT